MSGNEPAASTALGTLYGYAQKAFTGALALSLAVNSFFVKETVANMSKMAEAVQLLQIADATKSVTMTTTLERVAKNEERIDKHDQRIGRVELDVATLAARAKR